MSSMGYNHTLCGITLLPHSFEYILPFHPPTQPAEQVTSAPFPRPATPSTTSLLLPSKDNGPGNFHLTRKTPTSFSGLATHRNGWIGLFFCPAKGRGGFIARLSTSTLCDTSEGGVGWCRVV